MQTSYMEASWRKTFELLEFFCGSPAHARHDSWSPESLLVKKERLSQPADGWRIKFGRKIALLPLNESELECNAMNRPERVDKISAVASVPTRFQPLVLVLHSPLPVNAPLQPSAVCLFCHSVPSSWNDAA